MRVYNILFLVFVCLFISCKESGLSVYVSATGSNSNSGTKTNPVADLKTALLKVRELRESQKVDDTVFIWLKEGDYQLKETVVINELDSLPEGFPLVISAVAGAKVSINGAQTVDVSRVQPLASAEKSQFPPEVRDIVKKIELKGEGIEDYGQLYPIGFLQPNMALEMELFINQKAGMLARWPNDSIVTQWEAIRKGGVPFKGDTSKLGGIIHYQSERISQWAKAKDAWMHGTFGYGYADDALPVKDIDAQQQTIELALPHFFGVNGTLPWNWWYIYNLSQELDKEGEYYLDREKEIVYFYPPTEGVKTIQLSVMEEPLIAIENTSNIHVRNITFEATRGMAIYMEGGSHNTVADCIIRNTGSVGICIGKGVEPLEIQVEAATSKPASRMVGSLHNHIYGNTTFNREAGHHHSIINCEIYDTGQGGISLGGGDKITLEYGNNWVHNNHIYRYNRRAQSLKVAIDLYGVGNRISNNEIHSAYGMGIYMHGNEHVIEYNEVYNILNDTQDFGAMYLGRDPSDQGNVFRYNYIHDVGGQWGYCKGIYLDDGTAGAEIYGNIISDMREVVHPHPYGYSDSRGITVNGGRYNQITNNVFLNDPVGILISSILIKRPYLAGKGGIYEERLQKVNYQQPPYSKKYPLLVNYFEDDLNVPKGNVVENNIFLNVSKVINAEQPWEQALSTRSKEEQLSYKKLKPDWSYIPDRNLISEEANPYLLDRTGQIPSLNYDAIRTVLPNFEEIPIDRIGRKEAL